MTGPDPLLTRPDRGLRRAMTGLIPASLSVQVCSFVSSIALARTLGASAGTDAYYLGLSVPALVSGILLAALRLGAIPSLTDAAAEGGDRTLRVRGSELVTAVLVGSIGLTFVVAAATEAALPLLLGGGRHLVSLTRLAVLELAPLCVLGALTGTLSAILAVRRIFRLPIAVGVFEPLLKTAFVLALGHRIGMHALILGNLLGSTAAVVMLWRAVNREGIGIRFAKAFDTPFIRAVLAISAPLLIGQSVLQVNPVVDRTMVSQLGSGSVTALELGLRLYYIPSTLLLGGLIGPITATWASRRAAGGWMQLRPSVSRAIAGASVILPPLVVLGIVLRKPLVSSIYAGGAYSPHALHETTAVFGMIVLGLPAQLLVVILATLFVVEKETVFPMKIALANVVLNVLLNLAFRPVFGAAGIALSTALTLTILACIYAVAATRRWGRLYLRSVPKTLVGIAASVVVVGGLALGLLAELPDPTDRLRALFAVAVVGVCGVLSHGLVLVATGDVSLGRLTTRRPAMRMPT